MGIVAKFGGSSVKSAQAIERCVDIVTNFPEMDLIVVSATYQTTNKLEHLTFELLEELHKHHKNMAFYLDLDKSIHQEIDATTEMAKNLLEKKEECELLSWQDQMYCVGEMWSSWLFYGAISKKLNRDVEWLDARKIIKTDSTFGCAIPKVDLIEKEVSQLSEKTLYITQGFIGEDKQGRGTTLGREGSDYTATLIAAAKKSQAVVIWTDVPGISTIDPRVDNQAIVIPQMSYKMATTLAEHGAKVLFSKTLDPVVKLNIPVFVKSSLEPNSPGTCISNQSPEGNFGLAIKDKFVTFVCDNAEELEMEGIVDRGDNFLVFESENAIQLARDIHQNLIKDM
jgi:aspartate kinase